MRPDTAAAGRLRRWTSGEIPYAEPEVLHRHLEEAHLALVFDAFRQVLPFGTGGRRGPVGYGPNRMNPSTVAMTAQGHSNYLERKFPWEFPSRRQAAQSSPGRKFPWELPPRGQLGRPRR